MGNEESRWRCIPKEATESLWEAEDGWEIRRIDFPPLNSAKSRGALLFLPGRGDHYEKYLETLHYWANQGWHVTSIDWRGQGLSGRLLEQANIGYVKDFSVWIDDLRFFWQKWMTKNPGPHFLVAHSMGGHLAMRAAVEGAVDPSAIALSAPMLGIKSSGVPRKLSHAFAKLMVKMGWARRPAWKDSEKPLSPSSLRQMILTHSDRRYNDEMFWWRERPSVRLGPPSWRWLERAFASTAAMEKNGTLEDLQIPILLLATNADQLVSTRRIKADYKRLPVARLHCFSRAAAHELLREADPVRDKCLTEIDRFFTEHTTPK